MFVTIFTGTNGEPTEVKGVKAIRLTRSMIVLSDKNLRFPLTKTTTVFIEDNEGISAGDGFRD